MSNQSRGGREYVIPTYSAPDDTVWYHFLYGSVPGHQIDLMYRPELPHGSLSRQHFSHLLRLIKYVEPRHNRTFAFAIGNLSRDDTQHVPGHGGIALIFGLRVRGATDHTGRPDPPFSHAIAALDRELDRSALEAAALSFHKRLVGDTANDSDGVALYRAYAATAAQNPGAAGQRVTRYVESFGDLPHLGLSALSPMWRSEETGQPRRVVIVHPESAPFEVIAGCASRLASILYRSDVRWTSITTGRESDIADGVSIRLMAECDARAPDAGGGLLVSIEDIPREDADAAWHLFRARPVEPPCAAAGLLPGWRKRYAGYTGKSERAPDAGAGEKERCPEPKESAVQPDHAPHLLDQIIADEPTLIAPPQMVVGVLVSTGALPLVSGRSHFWRNVVLCAVAACGAALPLAYVLFDQHGPRLETGSVEVPAVGAAIPSASRTLSSSSPAEPSAKNAEPTPSATFQRQPPGAALKPSSPRSNGYRGLAGRGSASSTPSAQKGGKRKVDGGVLYPELPRR